MKTIAIISLVVFTLCTTAYDTKSSSNDGVYASHDHNRDGVVNSADHPDSATGNHDHDGDGDTDEDDHPQFSNTYAYGTGCHDHDGDGDTDTDDHPEWGNGDHDHNNDGDTDVNDHPCPPYPKHAKGKGSKHASHSHSHSYDYNDNYVHPTHDPNHIHPTHAHAHESADDSNVNRGYQVVQKNEGYDAMDSQNEVYSIGENNGAYIAVISVLAFLLISGIIIGLRCWYMNVPKQSRDGHVVVNDIEDEGEEEEIEIEVDIESIRDNKTEVIKTLNRIKTDEKQARIAIDKLDKNITGVLLNNDFTQLDSLRKKKKNVNEKNRKMSGLY
eukprot:65207_1